MPHATIPGIELYYEDQGRGQTLVLLHGVWMSSRFFADQVHELSQTHRVLALDFRSHGRSQLSPTGNTVEQYADDLARLLEHLQLSSVVLVGWSMGALVMWEYLQRRGPERIAACIVVSQSASDFCWPGWDGGVVDGAASVRVVQRLQTQQAAYLRDFLRRIFKAPVSEDNLQWMLAEAMRLPPAVAGAIFLDQVKRDYRSWVKTIPLPTLVCFGRDEKAMPLAGAYHLLQEMPRARLHIFEDSGHCPFLEEPAAFHALTRDFLAERGP